WRRLRTRTAATEIAVRAAIAIRIGTSGDEEPPLALGPEPSSAAAAPPTEPSPLREPSPGLPWRVSDPLPLPAAAPPPDEPFRPDFPLLPPPALPPAELAAEL